MSNKRNQEWIQMEHYRFHYVEDWAESAYKRAILAAIRSSLRSLLPASGDLALASQCSICRQRGTSILESSFEKAKPLTLAAEMRAA